MNLEGKEHYPAPLYKATQFISFTINTFGGLAAHGECDGRDVDEDGMCYIGNDDIKEDVYHRAMLVLEVLEAIKADINASDPEIEHSADVLKIFAMPEFYWRGPNGAYTTEQIEDVVTEVFDKIREYISDDAFEHYLFVFGTVITFKPPPKRDMDNLDEAVEHAEYGNFCPVYKGGKKHRHRFLVTKKYISNADFFSRVSLPNPRNYNVTEYKHDDFSPKFNAILKQNDVQLVSDNVLHIDGLTIGLEICLDHNMTALWDNLQKNYGSELVDVHVIVSAGMSIERGPTPVIPGGAVYLCDGTASSAACLRSDHEKFQPDVVCRAPPTGIKHVPVGHGYSEFFSMSACIDIAKYEYLEGYYSLYQTQGCAYTLKLYGIDVMDEYDFYPPSIEIYPVVELPRSAYEVNHD